MHPRFNSILNRQKGFTFIEVIIATMMLMLVVGAILQYFSTAGASSKQIYDLKAVAALKSEANKLAALYKSGTTFSNEFTDTTPPPNNIFLFRYNSGSNQIDIPSPIHRVYYGEYYADDDKGFTLSIGDNNTVSEFHTYYEDAFNSKYATFNDNQKRDIDLRTITYCPYAVGDTSTDSNVSDPYQIDVCMVVIDDMDSPTDPEDDLLGYVGWWVIDTGGLKEITIALQYWYPGADWKNIDPEVIVLKITVF